MPGSGCTSTRTATSRSAHGSAGVARPLADTGAAEVIIDHSTKAKDNPLFPSGSKRKRAAITGASYLVTATTPLTRDKGGTVALTCSKDRHGHWKRGEQVGTFDLHFYPDGGASAKPWPPSQVDKSCTAPDAKLRAVARAAIRATKDADHPLSGRELEALMNVKVAGAIKRAGIDHAIGVGALRTEQGPRRSVLHVYDQDLEDDTNPEP